MNSIRHIFFGVGIGIMACVLFSCREPSPESMQDFPDLMEIPKGFPEVIYPEGNEFTQARWKLGKKLFYEKALSLDSTLSCGSCHRQTIAFADDVAFTDGVAGRAGVRNVPSLANVAYHPYFTREGGVPTLEMQVLVPIQEHNEFAFNIVLLAERLLQDSIYVQMSRDAYQRPPDPYVITRAIACFERSLISGNSPYDRYTFQGKSDALSRDEVAGMELFFSSRTGCSGCHRGIDFTDYSFENNGLYETYPDPGRFRLTSAPEDLARFKVPGLRNVGLTAPYMHDGSVNTLEEVIDHYQSGGQAHPNKSEKIRPFDLSEKEKGQLVSFLNSLTDLEFIHNDHFKNQ